MAYVTLATGGYVPFILIKTRYSYVWRHGCYQLNRLYALPRNTNVLCLLGCDASESIVEIDIEAQIFGIFNLFKVVDHGNDTQLQVCVCGWEGGGGRGKNSHIDINCKETSSQRHIAKLLVLSFIVSGPILKEKFPTDPQVCKSFNFKLKNLFCAVFLEDVSCHLYAVLHISIFLEMQLRKRIINSFDSALC